MKDSSGTFDDPQYFLDRLIHDLREPLRSVYSYAELLAETPPGPAADHVRKEILSGAIRMRTLVDALSAYALALERSEGPASLDLALNMAMMALDRQIQESGAAISADSLPRVALSLERSSQLMENLISNSLRFRGDEPPRVSVSAAAHEPGWWIVRIEDNGIGLGADECEAVFQPFLRVHGRKYGGAGLGLTTARRIVGNHGGRIWMEPNRAGGCICSFTLPAAAD